MMRYLYRVVVIIVLLLLHGQYAAQAQLPDSLFVTIQDTLRVSRITDRGIIPASSISAGYIYTMAYPPYSITRYILTDCRRNGELLKLAAWSEGRRVHAPAELLTFNSRTEYFSVAAGDTISFYRSLDWIDPSNNRQDTNNYYSLDTLDMAVHLVRVSDGTPIQLDSLSVLPRVPAGRPVIYGERPIMTLVHYAVPSAFDDDSVFIGVTVRARGQGAYHWMRRDDIILGLSTQLTNAWFITYLNLFDQLRYGTSLERRSISELAAATAAGAERIHVTPMGTRSVRIAVDNLNTATRTRISVFDSSGKLVRAEDGREFVFTAPAAGAYYAAITAGDEILTATKVIIQD